MGSKFGFGKVADALAVQIKLAAVDIMKDTKRYFGEAFDKEQLGKQKWPEVQRRIPGTKAYKREVAKGGDGTSRNILAGETGKLRRKTVRADSSITNNGATSVMFNPVPYAGYTQDGTRYVPARPFMKQTEELTTIQLNILNTVTGKIWKVQP
jgi:hypothetical protein